MSVMTRAAALQARAVGLYERKACVGRKGPWPKLWSCSFESALDGTVTETDKVHGDRENDIDSDGVFHGTTASVTCRSPTAPFPKGDARVTVKFDGKALRTLAPPAGTSCTLQ